jgi:hypothetical protein
LLRVLAKDGVVILQEPVRFSRTYCFLRNLLPAHEDISEFEHPLTREELGALTEVFEVREPRYFRLPSVPLVSRVVPALGSAAWRFNHWILRNFRPVKRCATVVTMKLQK